jgi:predicted nuclease of predicted toxin-antitoxin system
MPKALKLYLDQMIHLNVGEALRTEGHNVLRAAEVGQSRADDYEILQKAIAEKRILVTLDDDFGDWAVLPLTKHHGVIRLKVNPAVSRNIIDVLLPFLRLHSAEQFKDHLVILSSKRAKWIRTG